MDKITDFINNHYKPLQVNDFIADALDLFLDVPYSHFPILEQNVFLGSISKEDTELFSGADAIGFRCSECKGFVGFLGSSARCRAGLAQRD